MNMLPMGKRRPLPEYLAWLITLVGVLFFVALTVQRHNAFLTTAFDLGNYDQAVWNTAHGHPLRLTNIPGVTIRLAHHVEPILFLIAPLYWIWSDPRMLLIVQATVVMAGALPAYWLARRRLGDAWAALFFPLAWVLYPPLEGVVLFDFHAVALASSLLLFAFNWLDEGRTRPFAVAALLAAMTKEEIGFLVAFMGMYAFVVQRRRRLGILTMLAGAGWSLFAIEVIIATFSPKGEHVFLSYYAGIGDDFLGLVKTALLAPHRIILRALEGGAIGYLATMMAPLGFLALLAPDVLLIAAPSFAVNLLSSSEPMRTPVGFHYPAPITPFVFAASIAGLARLATWARSRGWSSQAIVRGGVMLALPGLLWMHWQDGATPLARWFEWPQVTEHHRIGERIIARIPPDAAVSAQWRLNPHVSQRERVYQFPDVRDAEYVLIDVTIPLLVQHPNDLYRTVQEMLADEWGIDTAMDGWLLLRRGAPRKTFPDEFYTFARTTPEEAAVRVDVQFGDALRLVGYTLTEERKGQRLTLYWQRTGVLSSNTQLWPFYFDLRTGAVLEDTSLRPLVETIWYPPDQWREGEIVRTRMLPWPVPEPFGVAVLVRQDGEVLPPTIFDGDVAYRPDGAVLLTRRPPMPLRNADVRLPHRFETTPLPIELVRVQVPAAQQVVGGQPYTVTLTWQAHGATDVPLTVFTQVLNEAGQLVAQHDSPPADGIRPTTDWRPGERIQDQHVIPLPADLPPGRYRLITGMYDPQTGQRVPAGTPDNAVELHIFEGKRGKK